MKMIHLGYSVLTSALLLAGCSSAPERTDGRATFADLADYDKSRLQRSALPQEPQQQQQQLQRLYQSLLSLAPDPAVQQKVRYRLSQMATAQLANQSLPLPEEHAALRALVAQYVQLLQDYPQDPDNELIRYQLARSYDLLGEQDASLQQLEQLLERYPSSEFAAEAYFRKGDILYSRGQYEGAQQAYEAVLAKNVAELRQHALYMTGWSLFKQQQFAKADPFFLQALDELSLENIPATGFDKTTRASAVTSELKSADTTAQQQLRQWHELCTILSTSLSYQEQASSLAELLATTTYRQGPAPQRPLPQQAALFQALADFLQSKQLYDSALQSYRTFIRLHVGTEQAAHFQLTLIKQLLASADAQGAVQEQQAFIQGFGPASDSWTQWRAAQRTYLHAPLLEYLDYAARDAYQRQQFSGAVEYWQQLLLVLADHRSSIEAASTSAEPATSLLLSKYQEADIRYITAQAMAQAGQIEPAIAMYESLAYPSKAYQSRLFTPADAAYQALLLDLARYPALQPLVVLPAASGAQSSAPPSSSQPSSPPQSSAAGELSVADAMAVIHSPLWPRMQQFSQQHQSHPQASAMLLLQRQLQFMAQQYPALLADMAKDLPQLQGPTALAFWQLKSQAELAMDDYAAAEQSLLQVRARMALPAVATLTIPVSAQRESKNQARQPGASATVDSSSPAYQLSLQLASSIYQQAKTSRDPQTANSHRQRLLALPLSPYHEAAAFELLDAAAPTSADYIAQLQAFLRDYPQSERRAVVQARLVQAYQATEPGLAADVLQQMADEQSDPVVAQQAQWQAAQAFQASGRTTAARDAYQHYLQRFGTATTVEQHELAQEARWQLALMAEQTPTAVHREPPHKKASTRSSSRRKTGDAAAKTALTSAADWWREIIARDGLHQSDRSRYLAAQSQLKLGLAEQHEFSQVRLTHPLKRSLQQKRQRLLAAKQHFEASSRYGVASVHTQALYQLAELYRQLASDLLQSERPTGLDEMALEQYNLLLEEQAYPFEEQAITLYQSLTALTAAERTGDSRSGDTRNDKVHNDKVRYDDAIKAAFVRLAELLPAQYQKSESYAEAQSDAR